MATNSELIALQPLLVQKEWMAKAITGTPACAVGDILMQTIRSVGGVATVVWFNLTASTLFTVAPVIASLVPTSDLAQVAEIKQRWHISSTTTSQSFLAGIRNGLAVPMRIETLEISGTNNIWAAANAAVSNAYAATLTLSSVITGGTVISSMKQVNGVLAIDASVTMTMGYTSKTGTVWILGSGSINYPARGPVASVSSTPSTIELCSWAKGLILPVGAVLSVDWLANGSAPTVPTTYVNAVLVEA